MTTPEHRDLPAESNAGFDSPPKAMLGGMGRALVLALRFVGFVILVVGVVAARVAFRQNPGVGFAVSIFVLAGLALMIGAARVIQVLAADARREKPSPVIGGIKFAIGAGVAYLAIRGVTLHSRHYGLGYAVPYGWQQALPYAVLAAVGVWGILAGGLALFGRRPGWALKLAAVAAVAVGLGFGWPATSAVRHLKQLSWDHSERIAFCRDGRYVAIGRSSRGATVFHVDPCEEAGEIWQSILHLNAIAISPDGSHLAIVDDNKLKMYAATGGEPLFETTVTNDDDRLWYAQLSYSKDGNKLLVVAARKTALICRADNGDQIASLTLPPGAIGAALSPTGKYVAAAYETADRRVQVQVFEMGDAQKESEFEATFEFPFEYGTPLSWSPDSSRLLIRSNAELALFDWKNEKKLWQIIGRGATELDTSAQAAMFNADGTRILAILVEDRIDVINADDAQRAATINQIPCWAAKWSADGKYLVTTGMVFETDLWDISCLSGM